MRKSSTLHVVRDSSARIMPDVRGMTKRQAALAYAAAGLYVVPVQYGTKHPGSVVGDAWQAKSSIDPDDINAWWDENDEYGIALHCGRSDLFVIDVDTPGKVPVSWHEMLASAPANRTREEDNGKGHYFFLMPPDKRLGNGKGRLPKGWGDVRGANGVVILPPSTHPGETDEAAAKDIGGQYRQRRPGVIPELPGFIVDLLNEATPGEYSLTDKELVKFLDEHKGNDRPNLLKAVIQRFVQDSEGGRHDNAVPCMCWAFREARAGYYPARKAVEEVTEAFQQSLSEEGNQRRAGDGEWSDIVKWAAAQALGADVAKVRAEVEARIRAQEEDRNADGLYHPKPGTVTDQEHAQQVIRWISDRAIYAWDAASWILKREDSWKVAPKTESRGILSMAAAEMPYGEKPPANVEPGDEDWKDEYYEWELRHRYQSAQKSAGIAQKMTALVTTDDGSSPYTVSLSDMDTDPDTLWTPSGAIDLLPEGRTDENKVDLREVHLRCTRYTPLQRATPAWDALLAAVWPDPAVRAWALQLFAVGVTGTSPRMFIYLHGERSRGKTSIPYLIADVLGSYGRSDLDSAMISRDSKGWDRAALHGLRFGLIDEMPSGAGGPTEILKKITGGSKIRAEYKNKPEFTFSPTHTLVFASNSVPDMKDDAVVERLRAIPCHGSPRAVKAARAKVGDVNDRVWQQEAPGVLWQLMELAKHYRRNADLIDNSAAPASVRKSTAVLQSEQNVLEQWLRSHTGILDKDVPKAEWATPTDIYDLFLDWCRKNHRGRRYLNDGYSVDQLGRELSKIAGRAGIQRVRTAVGRRWNVDLNPANVKGRR